METVGHVQAALSDQIRQLLRPYGQVTNFGFYGSTVFGFAMVAVGFILSFVSAIPTLCTFVVALAGSQFLMHAKLVQMARSIESALAGDVTCSRCGYNLKGNRSGRCPECGTVRRENGNSTMNSGDGV